MISTKVGKLSALVAAVALLAGSASPALGQQSGEPCKPWQDVWECLEMAPR